MENHCNTTPTTYTTTTYTDDVAILIYNIQHIQSQFKLQKIVKWSHMDLNLSKCAITCYSSKSKLKTNTFKAYIQPQNITNKSKDFYILTQNEPYTYLCTHLMPSLKWNLQKETTLQKSKQQSKLLTIFPTSLK